MNKEHIRYNNYFLEKYDTTLEFIKMLQCSLNNELNITKELDNFIDKNNTEDNYNKLYEHGKYIGYKTGIIRAKKIVEIYKDNLFELLLHFENEKSTLEGELDEYER